MRLEALVSEDHCPRTTRTIWKRNHSELIFHPPPIVSTLSERPLSGRVKIARTVELLGAEAGVISQTEAGARVMIISN